MKLDDIVMATIGACVVSAMALSLTDCAQPPVLTGRQSACEAGCANIVALGCPEGSGNCVDVCEKATALNFHNTNPICWLDAGSIDDLNKCGVRCRP